MTSTIFENEVIIIISNNWVVDDSIKVVTRVINIDLLYSLIYILLSSTNKTNKITSFEMESCAPRKMIE